MNIIMFKITLDEKQWNEDLCLLFKDQVTEVTEAFVNICVVHYLGPVLDLEAMLRVTHAFLTSHLDYWYVTHMGLALEDHPEVTTDPEFNGTCSPDCA